jgi:hypothetical protein
MELQKSTIHAVIIKLYLSYQEVCASLGVSGDDLTQTSHFSYPISSLCIFLLQLLPSMDGLMGDSRPADLPYNANK